MALNVNKCSDNVLFMQHKQGLEMACSCGERGAAEDEMTFAVQRRDMKLVAAGKLGGADCPDFGQFVQKAALSVATALRKKMSVTWSGEHS